MAFEKALDQKSRDSVKTPLADPAQEEIGTAAEAGASRQEQEEARRLWEELGTDSPYFQRFYGGNDPALYNDDGSPKILYHGTAEPFEEFLLSARGSQTGAAASTDKRQALDGQRRKSSVS